MPTLINYNQGTFKNNAKPNKRRLQELQHSAARAHAARVAYWRKKGIPQTGSQTSEPRRSEEHDSRKSPTSSPYTKQEADSTDSLSAGRNEFIKQESYGTTSSRSGSLVTTSHPWSAPAQPLWRLGSQTASSQDDHHVDPWDNPPTLPKLSRLPTAQLFDPFESTPVRQEAEVVAAMDHYIHNWAPSQRPGLKYQTKDNPLIRDVFPAALQNVELFEATVALCLSFKAAGQNFQTRMCNWSLYHKGQALSGIRTKLSSGWVDEAVILATVFLMIIDNVFLDVDAYETHLYGLRKMAKAYKAESSKELFGGSLLSFIAWAESNALLLFGDRVALRKNTINRSSLEYPSQPFPSTLSILIGTLTPGFQSVALNGELSVEVLSILTKTIHWTRCTDPTPAENINSSDQTFLTSFDPRANSAEIMRLCRVSDDEHMVERMVCKAVYIYHANLLGWTCRCSGYRRVVEQLGETLGSPLFRASCEGDLWQWLALSTANAARRGRLQPVQKQVVTDLLVSAGPAQDWDSMLGTMKKFLFHSKLAPEWKQCWDMASLPGVSV